MNEFLESSPEPRAKMPVTGIVFNGTEVPVIEDKKSGVQVHVNPITGQTRHFKGLSSDLAAVATPRGEEDRHSLIEFAPIDVKVSDSTEIIIKANKGSNRAYGTRSRIASQHGSIAQLIAGVSGSADNIDKQIDNIISNVDLKNGRIEASPYVNSNGKASPKPASSTRSASMMQPNRYKINKRAQSIAAILKDARESKELDPAVELGYKARN